MLKHRARGALRCFVALRTSDVLMAAIERASGMPRQCPWKNSALLVHGMAILIMEATNFVSVSISSAPS